MTYSVVRFFPAQRFRDITKQARKMPKGIKSTEYGSSLNDLIVKKHDTRFKVVFCTKLECILINIVTRNMNVFT